MKSIYYRGSLLFILMVGGCAWQPETIVPMSGRAPSEIIDVEIDSSRSINGVEHRTCYVYPNDKDSIQYIIVNGKIVWTAKPLFIDSLAPYHLDGTTNTVSIFWPNQSTTDTESIDDFQFQIISPHTGDTIIRANGVTINYPLAGRFNNQIVDLDDGRDTLAFSLDTTGSIRIADTNLLKLQGPMLRITINLFTEYGEWSPNNTHTTTLNLSRSIQYPMK